MNLKDAQTRAVHGDRRLVIKMPSGGSISGRWFEDHMLDFVREHGAEHVEVIRDNDVQVTVQMVR